MWFFVVAVNTLIVLILALYLKCGSSLLKFKRLLDFSKTIPGPSFRESLANMIPIRMLPWLTELTERYGPIFRIWLGRDLFVIISDPELLKTSLSSNQLLFKSRTYNIMEPWLGQGLLTSGGEAWHRRRKMLTPAFHFKILSAFQQPMEENCNILISKLKAASGQDAVNIYPFITLYTLDIICETAMGIKKHAQMNSDSEYVQAVQTVCELLQNRIFSFWERFPIIYNHTAGAKRLKGALDIVHGETMRVINLRRKLLAEENNISVDDTDNTLGIKRRHAFLDMLLIAQKEGLAITDTEIREEVDTFMFEGHDTTSSAIAFSVYLLSLHPEVQEKAYQEIIQNEDQGKDSLKYLEAVIKESLRLYPSVPTFSRITHSDFQLGKYTLPEGATVAHFVYMAHRNPKEFENPEKFMPERFLDGAKEYHPYSYVPFSAGPRNCIGQKFAMMELKCTMFNLIKNFIFSPADIKVAPIVQLILKSPSGVHVRINPRNTVIKS